VIVALEPSLEQGIGSVLDTAVAERFASRLFAKDPTLWGQAALNEASIRLGWVDDPQAQRALVSEISDLREALIAEGASRVILCGMGGSSLGPEVMCASAGVPLVVIDTTHADVLAPVLGSDLSDVVVVVSSKSGGTVETDSARRIFEKALMDQGLSPTSHIVVVTDPDSPLHQESVASGYRVFLANPSVGGRYSALTAFGLVPCGLAGMDLVPLLDEAHQAWNTLSMDAPSNPGLRLGAALADGAPERNKILLADAPGMPGFGDWVEQLVAESTGKDGRGLLPVVGSGLRDSDDCLTVGSVSSAASVQISGGLGAQILLWEVATVFAAAQLGVNPFDQPNVESAKIAARELLSREARHTADSDPCEAMSVWASFDDGGSPETLIQALLRLVGTSSYVALCVFGDSAEQAPWRSVATSLEQNTNRPVTVGFGPRFLHSTGQFHKGGPAEGVFIQIVEVPTASFEIPGRDFDCTGLLVAQARGDAQVIAESGQPILSITVRSDEARRRVRELLSSTT
jgi:glucose-6-phosphate isomerase